MQYTGLWALGTWTPGVHWCQCVYSRSQATSPLLLFDSFLPSAPPGSFNITIGKQFALLDATSFGLPFTQGTRGLCPYLNWCQVFLFNFPLLCLLWCILLKEACLGSMHPCGKKRVKPPYKGRQCLLCEENQPVARRSSVQYLRANCCCHLPAPQGRRVSLLSMPLISTYCWYIEDTPPHIEKWVWFKDLILLWGSVPSASYFSGIGSKIQSGTPPTYQNLMTFALLCYQETQERGHEMV